MPVGRVKQDVFVNNSGLFLIEGRGLSFVDLGLRAGVWSRGFGLVLGVLGV